MSTAHAPRTRSAGAATRSAGAATRSAGAATRSAGAATRSAGAATRSAGAATRAHALGGRRSRWAEFAAQLSPNWFASVMGTGIVATAAVGLPVTAPIVRPIATAVWLAACLLLLLLVAATAAHWFRHGETARGYHRHPVMAHFYGAPPMAIMTVGSGALLLGGDLIGRSSATTIAWALWGVGTALGLVSAVAVPVLVFAGAVSRGAGPFGGWLMPVVPPMVSAATGALLIPTLPHGPAREGMFWDCVSLCGLGLVASFLMIGQIWAATARDGVGQARLVPTLWIVLGPLGQSIAATGLLGENAASVLPRAEARAVLLASELFGFAVLGFALLWTAIAAALTIRAARSGLPFALTWWSFTFPLGTCATGASVLARHSGLDAVAVVAVAYFAALVVAWASVTVLTVRGSVVTGALYR